MWRRSSVAVDWEQVFAERGLRGDVSLEPVRSINGWPAAGSTEQDLDFGEVKGQQHVKRAVEVATTRQLQGTT